METQNQNDRISEAVDRVCEEMAKENERLPPNPYTAVFFNALLSPLSLLLMLYGLLRIYRSIDCFPLSHAGRRAADLTLGLARESLTGFIVGLTAIGGALLWSMTDGKRRTLEALCGSRNRQQAFYSHDDPRPKAPPALRAAVQELREHWPATDPQPRLVLAFLKEPDWMGTPPQVRWSMELPGSDSKMLLPPAARWRTYTLRQF